MKFPGIRCECRFTIKNFGKSRYVNVLVMTALMFLIFGVAYAFAAGGGEGDGHQKWVATDSYRIMNFTVLVVGLFLLLRKPVANALNSRIKGIKEQLEDLEVKKAAAESELAKYVEKLAKLESEADNIIEDYIRQGNDAKARILKEAETAAEKLEEQAKKNIEHEFEQAKIRLKEDVLEKAMARAEEIIKTKISTDDQERLVDEYLNKVVA
jgi:F-type H+-transporting ATPase subunit b